MPVAALTQSKQAGDRVFEYQDASGLHVRKEFRFDPKNYVVAFSANVMSGDRALNPDDRVGTRTRRCGRDGGRRQFLHRQLRSAAAGDLSARPVSVERVAASGVTEQPVHEGNFQFAGIDDHYFLAAAVNPGPVRVEYKPVTLPGPDKTQRQLLAPTFRFPQPPKDARFFVGPKQFDVLQSVDPQLVRAINFGTFRVLAVPLLTVAEVGVRLHR